MCLSVMITAVKYKNLGLFFLPNLRIPSVGDNTFERICLCELCRYKIRRTFSKFHNMFA